ncbi:hypothetical protein BDA99DRAFT_531623 [Phascolomyces articulosus]|uniref:GRAM domain-containing protein n=1 Tax=Phascolomyces articulosus TaxID=60185 RepID=A0AAD5PLC5_9FUNG|nr:hypothetical protein BDA99DRAFT_531623 [Phascolomyces articulosus]
MMLNKKKSLQQQDQEQHARSFHSIFQTIPEKEKLLEIYRCAFQKDILIQGHLYVFEHHICFKANFFGWTTKIEFSISNIISIEKRKTIKLFPNAIEIREKSNEKSHVFTSFMSRDSAYQLIMDLWLQYHHNYIEDRREQRRLRRQQKQFNDSLIDDSHISTTSTTKSDNSSKDNDNDYYDDDSFDDNNKNEQPYLLSRYDDARSIERNQKNDYSGWILLTLTIVLLVSDISIAYRITHISHQLMQL